MKEIVISGANPSWQKVLIFEELRKGSVNRARELYSFASGKGINFARAARVRNACRTTLFQFAGGANGTLLTADLDAEGISHRTVVTAAATRCCITCLSEADGTMTELIEPAETPDAAGAEAYERGIVEALASGDALALCGTLPGALPGELYERLARAAARRKLPVLLDAWKGIEGVLVSGAPVLLKINVEELTALSGEADPVSGIRRLLARGCFTGIGITDGPKQAYWGDPAGTIYGYELPTLDRVVNPVGCGDTASAVTMSEFLAGNAGVEAFADGLAAAQANCLSIRCADYDRTAADTLRKQIRITEL